MLIRKGKAMAKSFRKPKQYLKKKRVSRPLGKFCYRVEMRQSRSDGDGRSYETPLDRKLFLFSPSLSLHCSIASFFYYRKITNH